MGVTEIIALIAALTQAAGKIYARLFETVELYRKMNREGRTRLTAEEEASIVRKDDDAIQKLVDEIAKR